MKLQESGENYLETILVLKKRLGYVRSIDAVSYTHLKNFSNKKVPFANEIKDYISKENSLCILDLMTQTKNLYKNIKRWN